jgi:hypothetical protein
MATEYERSGTPLGVPLRSILLAVSGGLVLVAIIALFLEVREAPARPNQAKIDEARQKHKRTKSAPPPSDPWSRNTADTPASPTPRLGVETPPMVEPAPEIEEERRPPPTAREAATPNLDGDPRLEISSAKDEANRLYDKMDYDGALQKALSVLEKEPGDVRMMRVVVSASCQLGDADKAKQYWLQLPPHDQNQMTRRCQRFGITFQQ